MKKFFVITLCMVFCVISTHGRMLTVPQDVRPQKEIDDTLAFVTGLMEDMMKEQQVHDIGGIPFGISREEALPRLRNKYGDPEPTPNTIITFKGIKYAGKDFDQIIFMFQSDGINSYLNACILIKNAKTKSEIAPIIEDLKASLERRYKVVESKDEKGFTSLGGGFSPLWDGKLSSLRDEYVTGWHVDVIEYEQSIVNVFGVKYAVRLIYGPYNYIHEEF